MAGGMAMQQEKCKDQAMGHRSEILGLVSGPATYQPSDLGPHHPSFFYLLIFAYTIEIIIPTLHAAQDYWEGHVR